MPSKEQTHSKDDLTHRNTYKIDDAWEEDDSARDTVPTVPVAAVFAEISRSPSDWDQFARSALSDFRAQMVNDHDTRAREEAVSHADTTSKDTIAGSQSQRSDEMWKALRREAKAQSSQLSRWIGIPTRKFSQQDYAQQKKDIEALTHILGQGSDEIWLSATGNGTTAVPYSQLDLDFRQAVSGLCLLNSSFQGKDLDQSLKDTLLDKIKVNQSSRTLETLVLMLLTSCGFTAGLAVSEIGIRAGSKGTVLAGSTFSILDIFYGGYGILKLLRANRSKTHTGAGEDHDLSVSDPQKIDFLHKAMLRTFIEAADMHASRRISSEDQSAKRQ